MTIPRLVQLMDHDENRIMLPAFKTIVQVVSNGSEEHKELVLNSGVLPILAKLLKHSCSSILNNTIFIIVKVTKETVAQVDALFTHKVVEGLLNLLVNGNLQFKKLSALVITKIVRGTF